MHYNFTKLSHKNFSTNRTVSGLYSGGTYFKSGPEQRLYGRFCLVFLPFGDCNVSTVIIKTMKRELLYTSGKLIQNTVV
jgi:hypothetical protein